MDEFREFEQVRIKDRLGNIFTGVKIRKARDGDGYYVESLKSSSKCVFIQEETYQAILRGDEVTISL